MLELPTTYTTSKFIYSHMYTKTYKCMYKKQILKINYRYTQYDPRYIKDVKCYTCYAKKKYY